MGTLVIDVNPVVGSLGHFALRWYGLAIAAAVVVAFWITMREAKRRGIAEEHMSSLGWWAVAAGFVGARLFHVIDKWNYFQAHPTAILAVQDGGLAIYGAILGGVAAAFIYARVHHLEFGIIADAVAPGLILGQAIGRIGCIINGDTVGSATSAPWGIAYTNPGAMAPSLGVAYQPTAAFEMAWDLLVFAAVWRLRTRIEPRGILFLTYLSLYSVGKFAISALRQESLFLLGMQEAQVIALAVLVVTLPVMLVLSARSGLGTRMEVA